MYIRVHEDSSTEVTPQSREKCIFRGARGEIRVGICIQRILCLPFKKTQDASLDATPFIRNGHVTAPFIGFYCVGKKRRITSMRLLYFPTWLKKQPVSNGASANPCTHRLGLGNRHRRFSRDANPHEPLLNSLDFGTNKLSGNLGNITIE